MMDAELQMDKGNGLQNAKVKNRSKNNDGNSIGEYNENIKLEFTRKVRWVEDGHTTPNPEWSTYTGVVYRETVQIALTYAALNGIGLNVADIRIAYLHSPA